MCRIDEFARVVASDLDWANIALNIKTLAKQQGTQTTGRLAVYSAPKLKEFGPVGKLTQGGSTGGSEAVNMGMQFMA